MVWPRRTGPVVQPSSVRALGRAGALDEAVRLAEQGVNRQPRDTEWLLALADACWQDGQVCRAGEVYQTVLESEPDQARARIGLARHELIHGQGLPAKRTLEPLAVQETRSGEVQRLWVEILLQTGELSAAEAALERWEQEPSGTRTGARPTRWAGLRTQLAARRAWAFPLASEEDRTVLPLELRGGVPVIRCRLAQRSDDGFVPVSILMDTGGAEELGLHEALSERIDATLTGSRPVRSLTRRTMAESGTLSQLQVGQWSFASVPVLLYDLPSARSREFPGPAYQGILGPGLFQGRILSLWFGRSEFALLDPAGVDRVVGRQTSQVPLLGLPEGRPVIQVFLAGRSCLALVDTGAAYSMISPRWADRLGETGAIVPGLLLRAGSRAFEVSELRVTAELTTVLSAAHDVAIDLLLGMDFLGGFDRVIVDRFHHTLSLQRR